MRGRLPVFVAARHTQSSAPRSTHKDGMLLTNKSSGTDQMMITMITKMQEMIGKAIVEGTVTVFVKSKDKEVPFSVTTYFVDYDSDLEIKQ